MPVTVQKIDLGRAKCGDWWEGIYNETLSINGVPVNLTGAVVFLDFKKSLKDLRASLSLNSERTGEITIGNATVGEFTVNGRNLQLEPGVYEFDCRVELANDHIHTIWCGSITMVQTVTEL
ncbi:MAG: hypothetical protein ACOVOD_06500 [Rhodoferax sp.]